MAKWIDVGAAQEFSDGQHQCVDAQGTPLVVAKLDGQFIAVHNVCPHAGLPLGEGELAGTVLTCPYHGYAYDLKSGKNADFPNDTPLSPVPVKVEDDRVMVEL